MTSRSHTHVRDHIRSLPPRLTAAQHFMCLLLLKELKDKQDAEAERVVQANFGPLTLPAEWDERDMVTIAEDR